jgi:hypothetical protein
MQMHLYVGVSEFYGHYPQQSRPQIWVSLPFGAEHMPHAVLWNDLVLYGALQSG